jgi:Uma2 family endonuclease
MSKGESPAVVIQSQLALQAQTLFGDYVAQLGEGDRCEDSARIRTGPNTIRDADLVLWSNGRIEPPILVLEVRELSETWFVRLERMVEYLRIGVPAVIILDSETESASVFRPDARPQIFEKDQMLALPDVLPGLELPVARFFEE